MILNRIAVAMLSMGVMAGYANHFEGAAAETSAAVRVEKETCVVTGSVKDASTGEAIPGATIAVEGQYSKATASDADGKFSIELPEGRNINLIVSATGFLAKRVQVSTQGTRMEMEVRLDEGIFDLAEIVVTGTRTEKTILNTPVLTHIITSAQIERNDFENIMDALEYNIPGLQFNSDPRGDNIKIQGLENKYILILVDGERLTNTPGGPIDFERLSTSNIKQIEVIKGAGSALYGSSAIGMIINIITKTPERKAEGWAKVRYSKFNELLIDGSFGTRINNFSSQTLFNRNSSDGYDLTPESPEAFTKQPSADMTIEEKLGWEKGGTRVTLSGSLFFNEQNNPPKSTKNTHYKSLNETVKLNFGQELGEYNHLQFTYYGDFYTRKTVYERLDSTAKNATNRLHTLRLMDTYTPSNRLQIVGGAEFNINNNYNVMQYGDKIKNRNMHDINGFAQADWEIVPLLNVIGGVRYTHHSAFGDAVTPKVNVMYSPGSFKLRAGYSRGFKAPDATELYSDFMMGSVSHNIGNPNLKAETSDYFSLSAEYLWRNFDVSVEIYQNSIRNKIKSAYVNVTDENGITSTELRYSNVDNARIRGVEVSLDYYPLKGLYLHGSYAFTDALDKKTGLQLNGNTRHSINCNASYSFNVFRKLASVSMIGHWCSRKINDKETQTRDEATGEIIKTITSEPQPAYSLWKLTLQYTLWKKDNMSVTATAGVQNIFNYKDPVTYTTYDPGRRFFGSVIFKF
ncbi:MAG: TonB-dependent receptor [Bacteroidales bacterium]|nr:TonB-dependent receptor [Bacteroidales bacterium]